MDSNAINSVQQSWLIAEMDKFAGSMVNAVTSSSTWRSGNNAIIITFDEGVNATSQVATIVITNHGPRGVTDGRSYNHYSLLASLQQTFGLGCLVNSCTATPMAKLFAVTGASEAGAVATGRLAFTRERSDSVMWHVVPMVAKREQKPAN